uniref:Putative secreted protein n=1 Tax=Anopheles darlingi TaxID=43151 RepID=A0A2M4DM07_ANODA
MSLLAFLLIFYLRHFFWWLLVNGPGRRKRGNPAEADAFATINPPHTERPPTLVVRSQIGGLERVALCNVHVCTFPLDRGGTLTHTHSSPIPPHPSNHTTPSTAEKCFRKRIPVDE